MFAEENVALQVFSCHFYWLVESLKPAFIVIRTLMRMVEAA